MTNPEQSHKALSEEQVEAIEDLFDQTLALIAASDDDATFWKLMRDEGLVTESGED